MKMKQVLLQYNQGETKGIKVTPFEELGKRLPIDQLFAPVIIREDLEQNREKHPSLGELSFQSVKKLVRTPNDMFYKNGDFVRYVFMRGEAAHGKTLYCLQLLNYWCKAKEVESNNTCLPIWEKGMDVFDFVFLVMLRHVGRHRTSLIDMICYDVFGEHAECHDAIRHVLSNRKYRCLVIIDGIDEWKPSTKAKSKLKYKGMPNVERMTCCTFFVTSRPWKFEIVASMIRGYDRVIEILGLDENEVQTLIQNVLINYFGIKKTSVEFKQVYEEMVQKAKDEKHNTLMQIPLLVIVSVLLWVRKDKVGNSMTTFYIALVRMLIERAIEEKSIDALVRKIKEKERESTFRIPSILLKDNTLNEHSSWLLTLGKIAYSNEKHLVFEKSEIANIISEDELQVALQVGLLSQSEASGRAYARHESFNFFHKTIQEFLMAIYVSSNDQISDAFLKSLDSISAIMNVSNVIKFISGLCPSLGIIISKHIVRSADSDTEIMKWRQTFREGEYKVYLLYKLQISMFMEMRESESVSAIPREDIQHNLSDVFLSHGRFNKTDKNVVRASVDLLRPGNNNVVSLYLMDIPDHGEYGITVEEMTYFLNSLVSLQHLCIRRRYLTTISGRLISSLKTLYLDRITVTPAVIFEIQRSLERSPALETLRLSNIKCAKEKDIQEKTFHALVSPPAELGCLLRMLSDLPNLRTLDIRGLGHKDDLTLESVLPNLNALQDLRYEGSCSFSNPTYHRLVIRVISTMDHLRYIKLGNTILPDDSLTMTPRMFGIEKIELIDITMSEKGWRNFITSLSNIEHEFEVRIRNSYIDRTALAMIRRNPCFKETKDSDRHSIAFSKINPARRDVLGKPSHFDSMGSGRPSRRSRSFRLT